jgi:ribosome-associated protein
MTYSEPDAQKPEPSSLDLAIEAARTADDGKAEDIAILDLRGLSPVADFFVIATGTSDRQLRAIADHIQDYVRKSTGEKAFGVSGYESATWILVDFVNVVVHLFDPPRRDYYDLELLWGDAPRVEWQPRSASA